MPTIEELLGESSENENTSSFQKDDLNKLAAEIGLLDETGETSGKPIIKEANMSLWDVYNESYPGDQDLLGQEKNASFEKEAAEIEEAMGAYAYDVFSQCVEGHLEKIAVELVQAHGGDETHPQRMESNEDTSEQSIDTAPQIQDFAMGTKPKGAVGEFEMKAHGDGEQIKAAALQKHLLKAQLGL